MKIQFKIFKKRKLQKIDIKEEICKMELFCDIVLKDNLRLVASQSQLVDQ